MDNNSLGVHDERTVREHSVNDLKCNHKVCIMNIMAFFRLNLVSHEYCGLDTAKFKSIYGYTERDACSIACTVISVRIIYLN